MEESLAGPIPTSSVEDSKEESVSKAGATKPGEVTIEQSTSKQISRKLYEQAVDDAQYLMAYASSKCPKDIKRDTIERLIQARHFVENKEVVDPKLEAEFWLAYQDLWKLVDPVTAECIRATESPAARKTINRHIAFTVSVLVVLLIMQIYWVIGNQLTTKLTELLQRETELSTDISANQEEYNAIERRFKQNEIDARGGTFQGSYEFSWWGTPEFERDTAENLSERATLEVERESLKSQIERNNMILLAWSNPWVWVIPKSLLEQETVLQAAITNNEDSIADVESQIEAIEGARKDNEPIEDPYYFELNFALQNLKYEKATLLSQSIQIQSGRAHLAAQFVLTILQSYLLPLLYGLLGAGTSALRSLSREVDQVIFSDKRRIQHVLRIALGALAGIMVGWFSFLYESTNFLGTVSPLAIAFLVGYNIELFFSLMDVAINWVNKRSQREEQVEAPKAPTPAAS